MESGEGRPVDGHPDGGSRGQAALREMRLLVSVLEAERDRLVSGDWEALEALLAEKADRSKSLSLALAALLPEDLSGEADPEEAMALKGALLHVEELASVNLVIARESSLIVDQVLREVAFDAQGPTYGSGGTVGPGRQSPALVSTRS